MYALRWGIFPAIFISLLGCHQEFEASIEDSNFTSSISSAINRRQLRKRIPSHTNVTTQSCSQDCTSKSKAHFDTCIRSGSSQSECEDDVEKFRQDCISQYCEYIETQELLDLSIRCDYACRVIGRVARLECLAFGSTYEECLEVSRSKVDSCRLECPHWDSVPETIDLTPAFDACIETALADQRACEDIAIAEYAQWWADCKRERAPMDRMDDCYAWGADLGYDLNPRYRCWGMSDEAVEDCERATR